MMHNQAELGPLPTTLPDLYDYYLLHHTVRDQDRPERHAYKLQDYGLFPGELLGEVPACTTATPIAMSMPIEGAIHTLRTIYGDVQHAGGPVEVIAWANEHLKTIAPLEKGEDWLIEKENELYRSAGQRFFELVDAIEAEGFDPQVMRVRPALDLVPEVENIMNQVRRNFMEAILYDATCRNFPPNHPVMWLDDDLTFMEKGTIGNTATAVRNALARIVKTRMFYTGRPGDTRPMSERDDAEKVAAIFALAHRMIEQNLADDDHGLYIEEHGIGMSLETWALAGIHDDTRVIGESRSIRIGLSRTVGLHGDTFVRLPNRIGTSYRGIEWQARYTQDLAKVALSSERELYKTHVEALADDKLYEELRNLHTRWPQPVEYQKSRRGGRSRVNDIHHAHA